MHYQGRFVYKLLKIIFCLSGIVLILFCFSSITIREVPKGETYSHQINLDNIEPFKHKYSNELATNIRNNENKRIYIEPGDKQEANDSVIEVMMRYCDSKNPTWIPVVNEDGDGYFTLSNETFKEATQKIHKADQRFQEYKDVIYTALNDMDLLANDSQIINKINKYIITNYSYRVTDDLLFSFTETKKGQCYHYARLFEDMCKAVNIDAGYVTGQARGKYHAWNYVIVDGHTYWFDVTWNEGKLNPNQWSWLKEDEFSKTHELN